MMAHPENTARAALAQPGRAQRIGLIALVLAACLLLVNRYQFFNGFTLLAGDRFDVVISTTILEHWWKVFRGGANWAEVGYFYPYTRTIAQTDAYFLLGVAYAPFRALGLDPFIAAELANMVIKSIGFVGAYILCRKVFALPLWWALLAAALFTVSNGLSAHSSRIQFTTVALAPVTALYLWQAIMALLAGQGAVFRRAGLIAGALYGAWCLSCFYMAWFFAFFVSVLFVVLLLRCGSGGRRQLRQRLVQLSGSVLVVVAGTTLAMTPFIYAFLPKSREVGVRTYESVFHNTVPLEGILQVGRDNLLFGRLYNDLLAVVSPRYVPYGEYANTGFSIILFFLFACGCVALWRNGRNTGSGFILASMALTTVITWLLTMNIGGFTGWYFVYHYFPGAKALNVVATFQIMLVLPVVVIGITYLARQQLRRAIAILLAALLIAAELNMPYLNLNRQAELARITPPPIPPSACRAFYTSGWQEGGSAGFPEAIYGAYAHNVSAMMLAQMVDIPTLNGVASFSPPDWNFGNASAPDYDERMFTYANQHGVGGLCKFDLNRRQWTVFNRFMQPAGSVEGYAKTIDFKRALWQGVLARGLSFAEPWGTWSAAKTVTLEFSAPLPSLFDLRLVAHGFGPNVGKAVTIQVGSEVKTVVLGLVDQAQVVQFDNRGKANALTITVPEPVSPKQLGMGDDLRTLGIAFSELAIVPR